jgi:peptidoglycan hydrolase-like protein with peptidoglycan-binding domain
VYYDYDEPYVSTYAYADTSGSTVAAVQRELAREGYDPGPIDGVLGGQTRSAIAAFQNDNGLAATGRIDTALLDQLGLQ